MAMAIPLVFSMGGAWVGGTLLGLGTVGATFGGLAGSMLAARMFPPKTPSLTLPRMSTFPTQTTVVGSAIPIVSGPDRIAGNIIYLGPSHPFTVKHKAEGGKGGGDEAVTKETRYRRSFLIGLCEGPATVTKAWKGKKEISLSEFTIFDGENNTNIAAVTGQMFAKYRRLCCVWFDEYDCGNQDAVPLFTFEIGVNPPSRLLAVAKKDADDIDEDTKDDIGYVFDADGNFQCNISDKDVPASYGCLWHENKSFYMTRGNFLIKCNRFGRVDEDFGS